MSFDKWRHYVRARLSRSRGGPTTAIREYPARATLDPGFRKAANALAYRHAQAGRDAEAIRYFEQVARLDDRGTPTVHFNLGFIYEENRRAAQGDRELPRGRWS